MCQVKRGDVIMFTFSSFFKRTLFLLSLGLLIPLSSEAAWYEAFGRAAVLDNDVDGARKAAVNDAVRNTLLEAGANIKVYQNYENGTLSSESMEINSDYPVKKVTVLEEQRTLNAVQVRVRVYIDDENISRCTIGKVKKSVLPVTFRFEDNLTYGGAQGLESMPIELSHMIFDRIGSSAAILLQPERELNFFRDNNSSLSYDEIRSLDALSRQENVQYVITGTIRSLAASDAGPSPIDKLFYSKTRRIDFAVSVYDAMSGRVVLRRHYEAESDWDYKQGDYVDIRSERFLSSSYGQRLLELASFAAEDIVTSMQCLAPSARVIDTRGDSILISVGQSSGVKKGQEFSLTHFSEYPDRQGKIYQSAQPSGALYKVTDVYSHSARLMPSGGNHLLNVSADDIVTLQ